MDVLTSNTQKLYLKYLASSLFAALATTIYCFVDTIAIGQSEGPVGAAAVAVITPIWGVTGVLALLCGIGGSVLMSVAKGSGEEEKGNAYFTVSFLTMGVIIAVFWLAFVLFSEQIFIFFGANAEIIPKVMEYGKWIIRFLPLFILNPFFGTFLRNDGAPSRAMVAVLSGGCVNIFGDWFLVFPLKMGMEGAAIASVLGGVLQFIIMSSHFFTKRCTLRLVKPHCLLKGIRKILIGGISAGILESGLVLITILMNNQIMKYGGTAELAVYGVIVTTSGLLIAMFSGVGQALQPLASANYGAGQNKRVKSFLRMAMVTSGVMGVLFTGAGVVFPVQIINLFIDATPEVLKAAPEIFRIYFLTFLPVGFSVLAIYYLQSIRKNRMAALIAVMRSILISGLLILILPMIWGAAGLWCATPISDTIVACVAIAYIIAVTKREISEDKGAKQ